MSNAYHKGERLPSLVEDAVNRHIAEFKCHLRTPDQPVSSFTYHMEFEIGDYSASWWVGRCDACKAVVRVRLDKSGATYYGRRESMYHEGTDQIKTKGKSRINK